MTHTTSQSLERQVDLMKSEPGHEITSIVLHVVVEKRTIFLGFTSAFNIPADIPILAQLNFTERKFIVRIEIEEYAFLPQVTSTTDPGWILVSVRSSGIVKSLLASEKGGLAINSHSIGQFHERQPNRMSLLTIVKSNNTQVASDGLEALTDDPGPGSAN